MAIVVTFIAVAGLVLACGLCIAVLGERRILRSGSKHRSG